jgi:hypothetical protein
MSRFVVLVTVALIGAGAAAQAGPCTAEIAQLQRQIKGSARSPAAEPSARQTVGAQLHHQPTPSAVESAESKANADAAAALERARRADAAGDAEACHQAVDQARWLYGVE